MYVVLQNFIMLTKNKKTSCAEEVCSGINDNSLWVELVKRILSPKNVKRTLNTMDPCLKKMSKPETRSSTVLDVLQK